MTMMAGLGMMADGRHPVTGSRRGRVAAVVAAVLCGLLLAGSDLEAAAASARATVPRMRWGWAQEVPGLGALNIGGNAQVNAVSCWRPGDCAAGGFYTDASGHQEAFVVTQTNGVWGKAEEVPGTAALNAGTGTQYGAAVTNISCAPTGYCAAAGTYGDSSDGDQQVFVVSETDRVWGTAREIPGTAKLNVGGFAWVESMSCPSAGNCAAGGAYETPVQSGVSPGSDSQAFVVSERDGRWEAAEEVPGMAKLSPPPYEYDIVDSVSCASAGNCTAGGFYNLGPNGTGTLQSGGFNVSEVNGRWDRLVLPQSGGGDRWVSCWHAGDCEAAGGDHVHIQTNGRWSKAFMLTALRGKSISVLSCPSAGNCAVGGVVGYYPVDDLEFPSGGYVLTERHGRWGKLIVVAGPADLGEVNVMSCASAGNCGAAGNAYASFDSSGNPISSAFVVAERIGRWAASVEPPGLSRLNVDNGNSSVDSVSCPSPSTCTVGGYYTDAAGHTQGFVDG
jgi:hypothetical protein